MTVKAKWEWKRKRSKETMIKYPNVSIQEHQTGLGSLAAVMD